MSASGPDVPPAAWPRYCEENVWRLCGEWIDRAAEALAIVISNRHRRVAVFCQCAGAPPEGFVAWDYHVVLAVRMGEDWQIVDPDTTLPCPCAADVYLRASFPLLPDAGADYRPRFRLVDAPTYRARLASDRRHMRSADGGWLSEPPPWPTIGEGHNLGRFVDLDDSFLGDVVDLDGLRRRLGLGPRP